MTVLVEFHIEIRFFIELHGNFHWIFHWHAREFKIVDYVMSSIIWIWESNIKIRSGLETSKAFHLCVIIESAGR